MAILMLSVVTSLAGQVLLKQGTLQESFSFDFARPVHSALAISSNPYLIGWVALSGVAAVLWVAVVSRLPLGFAYPFSLTISYVFLLLVSIWLFGEQVSLTRWAGVALMSVGLFLAYESS